MKRLSSLDGFIRKEGTPICAFCGLRTKSTAYAAVFGAGVVVVQLCLNSLRLQTLFTDSGIAAIEALCWLPSWRLFHKIHQSFVVLELAYGVGNGDHALRWFIGLLGIVRLRVGRQKSQASIEKGVTKRLVFRGVIRLA